jgi:hypothetical protein
LNTLCAVALPRLRNLQGKSRRTFGQFSAIASQQIEPCIGHLLKLGYKQKGRT